MSETIIAKYEAGVLVPQEHSTCKNIKWFTYRLSLRKCASRPPKHAAWLIGFSSTR
jgi:hypothetical protein